MAFNPGKSKFGALRAAFEEKHVREWMNSVRLVRERCRLLPGGSRGPPG